MLNFNKVGSQVGQQNVSGSIHNTYHFHPVSSPVSNQCSPQQDNQEVSQQKAAFRQQCVRSLDFASADDRFYTIETAHKSTCRWLPNSLEFGQWLDEQTRTEHHGFLWIRGNPGTGKSTMMKYILILASEDDTYGILIRFFFNARGGELERNVQGMYQSLLFQLTAAVPESQDVFDSLFMAYRSTTPRWTIDVLQTMLKEVIRRFNGKVVTCLIDALDECHVDEVRDMVSFFEELSEIATTSQVWLRILFSSRHYPYISVRHGIYLILEEKLAHKVDIETYVDSELKLGEDVPNAHGIRDMLLKKACGNFLWVKLVVSILNASWDRGRLRGLQDLLLCIPSKLEQLFDDIVSSNHDQDDYARRHSEMDVCIQCVLFSFRPLKLEELYWAIITMTEQNTDILPGSQLCSRKTMERFVLDSSKGLVQVTRAKDETVQFIHETVREYFRSKLQSLRFRGHDLLRTICNKYVENFKYGSTIQYARTLENMLSFAPFLTYAVEYVFHHSNAAQHRETPQDDFLETFNFGHWLTIHKVLFLESFGDVDQRPDIYPFLFPKPYRKQTHPESEEEPSLLYVLCDFGLSGLVECETQRVNQLEFGHGRWAFPLLPVIERKDLKTLQSLLFPEPKSIGMDVQAKLQREAEIEALKQELSGELGCLRWTDHDPLADNSLWDDTNLLSDESPLQYAARRGYKQLAQCLLATGRFSVDRRCNWDGYTALMTAAKFNSVDVARILMDAGADVNAINRKGCSILLMAARNHHVGVVRALLEYHPDLDYLSTRYGTALLAVLEYNTNQMNSNTKVLSHGISTKDFGIVDGRTERIASFIPRVFRTMVKSTTSSSRQRALYYGGDSAQRDSSGDVHPPVMPISVTEGRIETVSMLLEAGADPNLRGTLGTVMAPNASGQTPLTLAAMYGYSQEVRKLLEFGADPDKRNSNQATPLILAAREGHEDVVRVLINAGADLNLSSGITGTALFAATSRGRINCVKILRASGAE